MIRLTLTNGSKLLLNPDHITGIEENNEYGYTVVKLEHDGFYVTESSSEVARKVLEWRLAMEDYRIFTKRGASDGDYDMANSSRITLESLAGLEEN